MHTTKSLVFDIETVGRDFASFDALTKSILIDKEGSEEEAKAKLGLSPLTGQICSICGLDANTGKGAVYFQAPGEEIDEMVGDVRYKSLDEKEILEQFWKLAEHYQQFVTYNGRGFDIPFIIMRSVAHKIKPTKNLMAGRYAYQQQSGAVNLDLADQLSFYGATRMAKLHLFCQAFGITSPKESGDGSKVQEQFDQKRYREIATYNVEDVRATSSLFAIWDEFLRF